MVGLALPNADSNASSRGGSRVRLLLRRKRNITTRRRRKNIPATTPPAIAPTLILDPWALARFAADAVLPGDDVLPGNDVLPGHANSEDRPLPPWEVEGTEVAVISVVTVVNEPPASVNIAVEFTSSGWELEISDTVTVVRVVELELAGTAGLTLEPEDEGVVTSAESAPPLTMSA